ncbi:MAG: NADH-quinone oxidoreductase subunit C [marine bacterium B5-7]|nr:MAG: NADH-quinone oxidoreductase subunit C [marine bacterium B5-7]
MANSEQLAERVKACCGDSITSLTIAHGEVTIEVDPADVVAVLTELRDDTQTRFEELIDLCGVDYTTYGIESSAEDELQSMGPPHLAVVYHLLSLTHNHRLRVRVLLDPEHPLLASIVDVWPCADWFEREAFDLYGMIFQGHPDLRRLLTDYGFIGHPFRKDFPISGHVEMRYDDERKRVVYEPVSIPPRVLVPKVIRTEGYGD